MKIKNFFLVFFFCNFYFIKAMGAEFFKYFLQKNFNDEAIGRILALSQERKDILNKKAAFKRWKNKKEIVITSAEIKGIEDKMLELMGAEKFKEYKKSLFVRALKKGYKNGRKITGTGASKSGRAKKSRSSKKGAVEIPIPVVPQF